MYQFSAVEQDVVRRRPLHLAVASRLMMALIALMVLAGCDGEALVPGSLWARNESDRAILVRTTARELEPGQPRLFAVWRIDPHTEGKVDPGGVRYYTVQALELDCRLIASWQGEEFEVGVIVRPDASVYFEAGFIDSQLRASMPRPYQHVRECQGAVAQPVPAA